jgi:hypothetical protein
MYSYCVAKRLFFTDACTNDHAFFTGFFTSTVYHFLVHDEAGPIGAVLRQSAAPVAVALGLDTHTLGMCFVSAWMQVFGFLRMPTMMGPAFTPFALPLLFGQQEQGKIGAVPSETALNGVAKKKKKKYKTKKE